MNTLIHTAILFTILLIGCNKPIDIEYIDKLKPSTEPILFAKDFITKDSVSEYGSIFNKAKNEFYFAIESAGKSTIKFTKYQNGNWSDPKTIISDTTHSYNDPFLSNDESRLYYISDKPRNKLDTITDYDIWYSERTTDKWSEPINAGTTINTNANEYYISFTNDQAMYFASNKGKSSERQHDFDIYKSEYVNGNFQEPQKLSDSINSKRYEADVFISPDESYIIYCSARKDGLGKGDLYISFKDVNGNWKQSVNMGSPINSKEHELCPFVTKDGKYLFYTSNQDIYWVSTEIIESFK